MLFPVVNFLKYVVTEVVLFSVVAFKVNAYKMVPIFEPPCIYGECKSLPSLCLSACLRYVALIIHSRQKEVDNDVSHTQLTTTVGLLNCQSIHSTCMYVNSI